MKSIATARIIKKKEEAKKRKTCLSHFFPFILIQHMKNMKKVTKFQAKIIICQENI